MISILLGLLLPALSRAREQARTVQCLSNLRQLGDAFVMYANNNRLRLPAPSSYSSLVYNDWIFWERSAGRQLDGSTIAPYLGQPVYAALLTCPSDDVTNRARTSSYGSYLFSYVMVDHMAQINLALVRSPSQKVLLYEEDQTTIDDGYGTPEAGSGVNLLAIRHDPTRQNPDGVATGLSVNGACRGNVLFCDGHCEFLARNIMHTQRSWDPYY